MKKLMMVSLILFFAIPALASERDIILPEVDKKAGMDVIQAIETRVGSRKYDGKEVGLKELSTILWAGYGLIYEKGGKTVHGYDALSSATPNNRHSIPLAWGKTYLRIYVLLKDGAFEYLPEKNKLKFITDKNLIKESGSGGADAVGAIVIAADYNEMFGGKETRKNVAFMSAGSAAQNMYIAGAALNIQMLTQLSFKSKAIKEKLDMPKNVEPLALLPFGYSQ